MRPLFKNPRKRRKSDFYPTPPEAVAAVLNSGALDGFPKYIWEPACGEGPISKTLEAAGYAVVSTDLEDRGYGLADIDFLPTSKAFAPAIVTNPPFSLAEEFLRHARHNLKIGHIALILKADYFCAAARIPLFDERPPAHVLNFTWRLDFTGDGSPPMNCSCYVWTPDSCAARLSLLYRPGAK